ncbi:MAG: hypothetical protein ABIU05_12670 [Nitrospirales bacterium]
MPGLPTVVAGHCIRQGRRGPVLEHSPAVSTSAKQLGTKGRDDSPSKLRLPRIKHFCIRRNKSRIGVRDWNEIDGEASRQDLRQVVAGWTPGQAGPEGVLSPTAPTSVDSRDGR